MDYTPHPRVLQRQPPRAVHDHLHGLNGRIGLRITLLVGTMWTAYIFTLIALISLPSAVRSHNAIIIVAWIAQTFLQLVLLPIIIVGQNIQAKASDERANGTYQDAEAIMHEAQQIQQHLLEQDAKIEHLLELASRLGQPPPSSSAATH
jgi:hypothetical protein